MKSLDQGAVGAALEQGHGWLLQLHDEVSSTSDLAKVAGIAGAKDGLVVAAEAQTAGRGQRSNRWVTPRGLDLMFSILLRPNVPMPLWPRVTTLAALAVSRAVEDLLPLRPGIKWPNDVYLEGKKVSGLLAETTIREKGAFIVLGVGINVNSSVFCGELAHTATSLKLASGSLRDLPRELVLATLLNHFKHTLQHWDQGFGEVVQEVRNRSLLIGRNVRALLDGLPVFGRVRDLDQEGRLILEGIDGRTQTLASAAEVRPVA